MARKKKNSDGYDGDSYDDDNGQLNLDDQLFGADMRHYRDTEQFVGQVERIYQQAITDLSNLASQMQALPQDKSFEFRHNPRLAKAAQATIEALAARIAGVIDAGCRQEWDAACIKGDQFVKRILGTSGLDEDQVRRYQDRNLEALAAFQERKVDGLNLSERVWKMVKPLKEEVELAVDTSTKYFDHGVGINTKDAINKVQGAIGRGTSAAELSREVRECLQYPDKLFRRVKDKYGNLTLSKAAKLYHPGPGVYRSSYKNAMRLTRSEINMAYRQSDTMRWQQLDFVVGMEVHTSNNHTTTDPKSTKRIKLVDICDELKGKYPKDFKFVGWHPQCRCYMTPILKTREEMNEDRANIDDPDYVPKQSVNAVTDTPKGFQQYMQDNAERMKGWSSTPYYIKDNPHYFDRAMHPGSYKAGNALQLTADQSKALSDFQAYANNHQGSKQFASALADAQKAMLAGDQKAFDAAMTSMGGIQKRNDRVAESLRRKKNREIYEQLKNNDQYKDVEFDETSAGVSASHKEHNFDKDKGWYEKESQRVGFENGHVVILEKEIHNVHNLKNTEGTWDGLKMEIAGAETCGDTNIRNALKHCAKKPGCEVAVIFLPKECNWSNIRDGIKLYEGLKKHPEQYKVFKGGVYFIHEGQIKKHYLQEALQVGRTTGVYPKTVTFHRGAKISTNSQTTNDQEDNSSQSSNNRQILIRKRSKSPKERRHEWDERIAELKANASKYHLDPEAIDKAYTSLDLKKLEQVVSDQEKLLARRTKTYASVEKKHKSRTASEIEDIKKRAKERQDALDAIDYIQKFDAKKAVMVMPKSADLKYSTAEEWQRAINELLSQSLGYIDWNEDKNRNNIAILKRFYDQYAVSEESKLALANITLGMKLSNEMKGLNLIRMPKQALIRFSNYLKNIDSACKNGYYRLYETEIDGIKNLKELIKKKVDFDKISSNMPVELLSKSKALAGDEYVFDKRIFDSIGRYVKLEDTATDGGYFDKTLNLVHIDSSSKRSAASSYGRKKVIYHEFGHAAHWTNDQYSSKEIQKIMSDHVKISLKKYGLAKLDKELQRLYYARNVEFSQYGCENGDDMKEMVMAAMDTVQSMTQGKHGCIKIDGHSDTYWDKRGNRETEFAAHMSEAYYVGNPVLEKLLPELYKAMITAFKYH